MYVHHYLHQNEYLLCLVVIQTGFRFCENCGVHHLSEAENKATSATRDAGEESTGMLKRDFGSVLTDLDFSMDLV